MKYAIVEVQIRKTSRDWTRNVTGRAEEKATDKNVY